MSEEQIADYRMMRSKQQPRFDPATLRDRLRHVYWIGGGSGAGKSTVARRVAAEHDLRLYSTDDAMAELPPKHTGGLSTSPRIHGDGHGRQMVDPVADRDARNVPLVSGGRLQHHHRRSAAPLDQSKSDRGGVPAVATPSKAASLDLPSCCLAPPDARVPPSRISAARRMRIRVSCQDKRSEESTPKPARTRQDVHRSTQEGSRRLGVACYHSPYRNVRGGFRMSG